MVNMELVIWQGNDGQARTSYQVTARTVKFLGKREGNGGPASAGSIGDPPPGGVSLEQSRGSSFFDWLNGKRRHLCVSVDVLVLIGHVPILSLAFRMNWVNLSRRGDSAICQTWGSNMGLTAAASSQKARLATLCPVSLS
jgi:hypothetical protein